MPKLDTLFPVAFSHSMMQTVWSCEMKFFRQHVQRLTNGHARSSDLIAGGHFAKACEIVRKSFYNDKLSIDEAIELGYNSIIDGQDTGDYIKSNRRIAICLKKHFKTFPLDNNLTPVKLANGEHAIEYSFDIELGIEHPDIPGTSIRYKGLLDGLYEKTHLGKRVGTYVVDEKTCSSVFRISGTKLVDIPKEEDRYKTDEQFISYHWAARQLGIKPVGTLVYKIPLTADFEPSFCLEIPITDFLIEIWSATLYNKIEELKDKYLYYKNQEHLPHYSFYPALTDSACVSYGRRCSFTDGCRYKGEDVMAMTHEQRVWDSASKRDYTLKEYKQLKGIK